MRSFRDLSVAHFADPRAIIVKNPAVLSFVRSGASMLTARPRRDGGFIAPSEKMLQRSIMGACVTRPRPAESIHDAG